MRVVAIGDIHGCLTALVTLLAEINPQPEDTIVTLGDYVDRGPDSKTVIERLIWLGRECHGVSLHGNHDIMMLEARESPGALRGWCEVGGEETLFSYGGIQQVPDLHWNFLQNQCVAYWENDTHFFVHANAYLDMPLFEQPDYKLFWDKFDYPPPHESGKIMVCGHTSQKNGLPLNIGHAVCIDTRVYDGGWLTGLDVKTGQIWQANQYGELRHFWLDEIEAR